MKKRVLRVLGIALLILWMIFVTPIVTWVYNLPCGMKQIYDYPAHEGAICEINTMKNVVVNDPFCSVICEGIYTGSGDTTAISVFLISRQAIYSMDARMSDIEEDGTQLATTGEHTKKTGFKAKFSPLNMKDGSYRIAVLIVEGNVNKALEYCPQSLNKYDRSVTIDGISTTQIEPVSYVLSNELRYSIDSLTQYTDNLVFEGWFFKPGSDYSTPLHEVIVETTDASGERNYWSAAIAARRDVADALGLGRNTFVGFQADIPLTDVKTVRLILQTNSGYASPEEAIPVL